MNADSQPASGVKPAESLTDVLGQTQHAKTLVDESATELSTIHTSLQRELVQEGPSGSLKTALRKTQAVEEKVQQASGKLANVTQALGVEVSERQELHVQLAEMTAQESAARHAALHDALTGLANRSLFNDRLEHGLAQARRLGLTLAVMFMDLDGFKAVNDTHGHEVGDALLQTVADRLRENTREDDTVARVGGDEFLYLVMGSNDIPTVANLAQKIIDCVQAPCRLSVGQVSIRLSMGIACYPLDGDTVDALVKQADMAMYRAKRGLTEFEFSR
jgi:diguanylate cyclase (GGDEF)-like protein